MHRTTLCRVIRVASAVLISACLTSLEAGEKEEKVEVQTPSETARYILPDIGFEIEAPDGFKLKQGIWHHEGLHATLHFAYAPDADFEKVASEFTTEAFKKVGKTFLGKTEVQVSGRKGLLVNVSYTSQDIKRIGWFVVFPDDPGVCQVGAIVREESGPAAMKAMRQAVLSVKRTKPK